MVRARAMTGIIFIQVTFLSRHILVGVRSQANAVSKRAGWLGTAELLIQEPQTKIVPLGYWSLNRRVAASDWQFSRPALQKHLCCVAYYNALVLVDDFVEHRHYAALFITLAFALDP